MTACSHLNSVELTELPEEVDGCPQCLATGDPWCHLRICLTCGQVGCCDSSPSQHARAHFLSSGHPYIQSFEPGEDWFWDFANDDYADGPPLTPPAHHPHDQPVPGPAGSVPADWPDRLHR